MYPCRFGCGCGISLVFGDLLIPVVFFLVFVFCCGGAVIFSRCLF